KIRQAGIDTHASPGDKEHHVRSSNKMSSLLNGSGIYTGRFEHVILPWQCADDIKLMSCNRMGFFPNKNEGNARCYAVLQHTCSKVSSGNEKALTFSREGFIFCGSPTWTRTRDLRINSPSLYRLSYQGTETRLCINLCGLSNPSEQFFLFFCRKICKG